MRLARAYKRRPVYPSIYLPLRSRLELLPSFFFFLPPSSSFSVTETNGRRQGRDEAGREFLASTTRWNIGLGAKSYADDGKVIIVRFAFGERSCDFCKSVPLSWTRFRWDSSRKNKGRDENYYEATDFWIIGEIVF